MILRARVRLEGLWVEPGPKVPVELAGTVVPWERLTSSHWVCDERGTPARRGHVREHVALVPRTKLERQVAYKARRRALRRRWQTSALDITDDFSGGPTGAYLMLALLIVGAVPCLTLLPGAWRLATDLRVLGPGRQSAGIIAIGLLLALVLWAFGVALLGCARVIRCTRFRSCTVSAEEIRIVLRDGGETRARWREVRLTPGLSEPMLDLPDGVRIQLPARMFQILRYRPPDLVQQPPVSRARRGLAFALLFLAAAGATVSAFVASDVPRERWPFVLVAICFLPVLLLTMTAVEVWIPLRIARWARRRTAVRRSV